MGEGTRLHVNAIEKLESLLLFRIRLGIDGQDFAVKVNGTAVIFFRILFVCSFLSHYDTLIIDNDYLLLNCPVLLDHYNYPDRGGEIKPQEIE
ncbi:hypothetical protein DJ031_06000 [bacterium endosymbiont of Escarpia laminata]|nr:MAG: hypothetical protein DJ031_06000 [bacterium endosymbiont of Escarpia laminata]